MVKLSFPSVLAAPTLKNIEFSDKLPFGFVLDHCSLNPINFIMSTSLTNHGHVTPLYDLSIASIHNLIPLSISASDIRPPIHTGILTKPSLPIGSGTHKGTTRTSPQLTKHIMDIISRCMSIITYYEHSKSTVQSRQAQSPKSLYVPPSFSCICLQWSQYRCSLMSIITSYDLIIPVPRQDLHIISPVSAAVVFL